MSRRLPRYLCTSSRTAPHAEAALPTSTSIRNCKQGEVAPRICKVPEHHEYAATLIATMIWSRGSPGYKVELKIPRPGEQSMQVSNSKGGKQASSCEPLFFRLTWHIIDKHEMTITGILYMDHREGAEADPSLWVDVDPFLGLIHRPEQRPTPRTNPTTHPCFFVFF